ncbi:hypothetical protein [Caballeronia sp. DA-9]|uniref:hypothetical protein n=1 Tax=Caballeronia sp. DA-9 TaxID=3436237 RepID=UPI003F66DE7B
MSRQSKEFYETFRKYRTTQFSAADAFRLFVDREPDAADPEPWEVLSKTQALSEDGWIQLDNRGSIAAHVTDPTHGAHPFKVLRAVMGIVVDYNISKMRDWKPHTVPDRFAAGGKSLPIRGVNPIISTLIDSGKATLRELQEYYALDDAVQMYDVHFTSLLNRAFADEAAMKKAKSQQSQ